MKDDRLYLIHILERIERIQEYTASGEAAFLGSRLLQDAVITNFQVIGEAVKSISRHLRGQHPEVPWRKIAGLRDVVVHDYTGIKWAEVWRIIEKDLPLLKENIAAIRAELGDAE